MAAGATQGLSFRLPARSAEAVASPRERLYETWRVSIWTTAVVGTAALMTTALNAVPGAADEIVMASAYTLTGVLGHIAPRPE